ncbi:MAG: folate-binding protein, partial [Proteobacteria bacterium]|nr:folate-binding protein [Pseudomonadota bacterium]
MVSADVAALRPGPEASGCYATLLTPQGRIVADLHVLAREESYWLELSRPAVPPVIERLSR